MASSLRSVDHRARQAVGWFAHGLVHIADRLILAEAGPIGAGETALWLTADRSLWGFKIVSASCGSCHSSVTPCGQ
jgi:hypothetical protein